MNKKTFTKIAALLFGFLSMMACTDDNSDLGISLTNPDAQYKGALYDSTTVIASTFREDSMNTANYANGVLGISNDDVFGKTEAAIFTQVSLSTTGGISFETAVDSVVLSLTCTGHYTKVKTAAKSMTAHFEVQPLAQSMNIDSSYTSSSELACLPVKFFDSDVKFSFSDTVINLKLKNGTHKNSIHRFFDRKTYRNNEEFLDVLKGLRIKMTPKGIYTDNLLLYVNFAASNTGLTVYYHDRLDSVLSYNFILNERSTAAAAHSNFYRHTYAGTPLSAFENNAADSISGQEKLYLQPLGGTFVKLRFPDLSAWSKQHPHAVIHQAKLILPVADDASNDAPANRLLCYRYHENDSVTLVPDLIDGVLSSAFNGYYDKSSKQYVMRISRQIQQVVSGITKDCGLAIYIDARRTAANPVVLNGTSKTLANHVKLEIIYSETK